jgi:DNA N-6-adenine-methyltransferase Dam
MSQKQKARAHHGDSAAGQEAMRVRTRSPSKTPAVIDQAGGLPANFEPERTRERSSVLAAAIEHARRMKDWPSLETAVDLQIAEQQAFVGWWDGHVRGGGRPKKVLAARTVSVSDAEKATGVSKGQVHRWRARLDDVDSYRAALRGWIYTKAMSEGTSLLLQQSLSVEHYTPGRYVEAVRAVLGGIDLDPASCKRANRTVRAKTFFDIRADGLKQDWCGRILLNPPYSRQAPLFVDKLMAELKAGNVTAAVVLLSAAATSTQWFQPLWDGLLCFTDHRIAFEGPGDRSSPTIANVFVYLGPDEPAFVREFERFGAVVQRSVRDGGQR